MELDIAPDLFCGFSDFGHAFSPLLVM